MTSNIQPLLHQLTLDTSNTSVPSKPSTSLCSTRLGHQASENLPQNYKYSLNKDNIFVNDNTSFATPIEAIYLPDIKSELDLDECEVAVQSSVQTEKPSITPPSSLSSTDRLQHPQGPRQLSSRPQPSKFKDLSIRVPRVSDPVNFNVKDNPMLEQRNGQIKLEPVTMDPCVCNDQESDNMQQNLSSTVDDDDIEVPFEAICDPVVKCEQDLVKTEPSLDLSATPYQNSNLADNTTATVKQEEIANAKEYLDIQPYVPELKTSLEIRNPSRNKNVKISDSVFSCAHCNLSTNCKRKITSHIVDKHFKISNYQCQKCNKFYKHKNVLRTHVSRVHPAEFSYQCLLCKRGFQLEKCFNGHIKNHDKIFQCDVCGKILSRKRRLTEHKIRIHTKSSPLSCDMCSKIFYSDISLKDHKRQVHSNLSFKCDVCGKSFKLNSYLLAHQREVHASVRAFSCNQCEKTFVSKVALKSHSVVHSDLRPFKCEKCGLCFNRSGDLTNHIRSVHSNVIEKTFKCHLCGKSFRRNGNLTQHLISHNDVRNYTCEQCGKQFKTKNTLTNHLSSHSEIRPFACAQCHNKFKSKLELVIHLRQVHSDLRPFSCDKCSLCFKIKQSLARHIGTVHSNVRAFKCHLCGQGFKYNGSLTKHLISHSNVRNYKCEQCGKLFKTNRELQQHLTSHGEIRPFACAQCYNKFKCKADLVQHLRYVHSDLRPFSCDKCSLAFKSKFSLKVHQLVHSNVRKFECCHCKSKFKCRDNLSAHIKTKHLNLY